MRKLFNPSADDVELSGWTVSGVDAFTAHEVFAPIGARDCWSGSTSRSD